jgi:hypothetical protein
LPPAVSSKKRRAMELISYDELMSNAGMSGFVSFLEHPSAGEAPNPEVKEQDAGAVAGTPDATTAISPRYPADRSIDEERSSVPSPIPGARQSRIRKAVVAEDGHSLAEQAVYEVLWKASSPLDDGTPIDDGTDADRTIRIGYHRLAQMTRLSWVSVKSNLRTLETKLAIEVTGSENSATREGKCYRVYSRTAIVERRKKAGLEWVRRTRGVELLTGPTGCLGTSET